MDCRARWPATLWGDWRWRKRRRGVVQVSPQGLHLGSMPASRVGIRTHHRVSARLDPPWFTKVRLDVRSIAPIGARTGPVRPPGPQTADGRGLPSGASKGASDTDAVWSRSVNAPVAGDPGTLTPPIASQCGLSCCNTRQMRCMCGWASRHSALCRKRRLCQRPVRCPTHMRIVLKINVMRRRSPGLATSVGPPQPERSRGRPP